MVIWSAELSWANLIFVLSILDETSSLSSSNLISNRRLDGQVQKSCLCIDVQCIPEGCTGMSSSRPASRKCQGSYGLGARPRSQSGARVTHDLVAGRRARAWAAARRLVLPAVEKQTVATPWRCQNPHRPSLPSVTAKPMLTIPGEVVIRNVSIKPHDQDRETRHTTRKLN